MATRRRTGHVIYLACDEIAQDPLLDAEQGGQISLDVSDNQNGAIDVVEPILKTIAKDTQTEFVRFEVDLLTNNHKCERRP